MATYINVVVGGDDLLSKVKGQQQAGRFAFQEQQRRRELEQEVKKDDAAKKPEQGRKLEPTSYRRELTAHRHPSDGLIGVAYRTFGDPSDQTLRLEVGLPGFGKSITIAGISDPGQKTVNNVTLPASGSSSTGVDAPPGIHYHDSRYTKPYQAWSGLHITGSGSPPNLYQGTTPPPLTSTSDTWVPYYTQTSTDKSRVYALPVGPSACVFVYLHNKLKLFNIYRKISRRQQRSVNPRGETSSLPQITSMTWYDGEQDNLTIYEFDHLETFAAYNAYCVLVTDKAVRQIPTPSKLLDNLKKVSPPVASNKQVATSYSSGGGQYSNYGPPFGRPDYFYTLPSVSQNVAGFDDATWNAVAIYGTVPTSNQVLAKQFGLGRLNTSSHAGDFFTPAVFRFLGGGMTLSSADSQNYAAMRTAYYPKAPFQFLAPCVQACSAADTEFYVTRTQPTTITSRVPDTAFQKARAYTVKQGEASPGTVLYCWDWGDKAACRASLLALGFSPSDLA